VILGKFAKLDPEEIPGVLVIHHGPFAWGPSAKAAVENALAIELCARLAFHTLRLGPLGGGYPPSSWTATFAASTAQAPTTGRNSVAPPGNRARGTATA